jgi:hypothetical protein
MSKWRLIKIVCAIAVTLVIIGVLMATTVSTRALSTCVLCRAERTHQTWFGHPSETVRDTEFTEWYRAHQPAHEHTWGRVSCTRGRSIIGTTTFFGCGPRHPAGDLSPVMLRDFARQADTNTLNAYFAGITSTNREIQRETVQLVWDKLK